MILPHMHVFEVILVLIFKWPFMLLNQQVNRKGDWIELFLLLYQCQYNWRLT
jgi:hypothetical protein